MRPAFVFVQLVLTLCGGAFAQDPFLPPRGANPARIEVLRGRSTLIHGTAGGKPEYLFSGTMSQNVRGVAHLEVAAAAEVRLVWSGVASIHVWGPASLQWGPISGVAGEDQRKSYDQERGLAWRFFDVGRANIEIRRSTHLLQVEGDWRAHISAGAFHLRGLPTGPIELRHTAGQPLRLEWRGDAQRARPPRIVHAGSEVRLVPPVDSPLDATSQAAAWGERAWPWRSPKDSPREVEERLELGGALQRQASGPAPWWGPPRQGSADSLSQRLLDQGNPRVPHGAVLPFELPIGLRPTDSWRLGDFYPGRPAQPAPQHVLR